MSTVYERKITDPLLKIMEKNQDFLCKEENLPQLAKIGYAFNLLFYAGRICYGYEGIVKKGSSCENNPKYEISDKIRYDSNENEDYIYDAWSMHVSNDIDGIKYEDFIKLMSCGSEEPRIKTLERKSNKSFEEWVDLFTDNEYAYNSLFPDRRSVADYLLCTIGTGYIYDKKSGTISESAGGARVRKELYGNWENSVLGGDILEKFSKVLNDPLCKIVLDAQSCYVEELREKKRKKKFEERKAYYEIFLPHINEKRKQQNMPTLTIDDPELVHLIDGLSKRAGDKFKAKKILDEDYEYYPISDYSIITKLDENSHPSYIKAAIEVCEHILKYPPRIKEDFNEYQKKQREECLLFCEKFIKRFK